MARKEKRNELGSFQYNDVPSINTGYMASGIW